MSVRHHQRMTTTKIISLLALFDCISRTLLATFVTSLVTPVEVLPGNNVYLMN